jgi:hypothetical protein
VNSTTPCSAAPCSCGSGVSSTLERPRYYPRQLITPADMTQEQDYFRDRLRRHNRLLHGWGVVCGGLVCPAPATGGGFQPWMVSISPAFILGPYGDEILIAQPCTQDLRTSGSTPATGSDQDPWCAPIFVPPPNTGSTFVAVKYAETQTRPVRTQPTGCGCSTTQCEYSRYSDGFEIGVLASLPASYNQNEQPPTLNQLFQGPPPACPKCPTDPWVVLASVTFDSSGTITAIDNCSFRRLVASFAGFWWRCSSPGVTITNQSELAKINLVPGQDSAFDIQGTNFTAATAVDVGPDITVRKVTPNQANQPTSLQVTVTVDQNATLGMRVVTVKNPDCSLASATVNVAQKPARS